MQKWVVESGPRGHRKIPSSAPIARVNTPGRFAPTRHGEDSSEPLGATIVLVLLIPILISLGGALHRENETDYDYENDLSCSLNGARYGSTSTQNGAKTSFPARSTCAQIT